MGWCSGTYLFDDIMKCILEKTDIHETIKKIIEEFEDQDWDCQQDSLYWDHPVVQQAMKELHPEWFEDE